MMLNNMRGVLPEVFRDLPALVEFSCNWNFLRGTIPVSLLEAPKLRSLVLTSNELSGSVSLVYFVGDIIFCSVQVVVSEPNIAGVLQPYAPRPAAQLSVWHYTGSAVSCQTNDILATGVQRF